MATNQTPAKTAPAAKKAAVAPIQRVSDQMKRAALAKRLSLEDLDKIATLAGSLKVFVTA